MIVGAQAFPGNPYDGHTSATHLEQTNIRLEALGVKPQGVFVDLGCRGLERDDPHVVIHHWGKYRAMTTQQHGWFTQRQAIESIIGHLKADHRIVRCWVKAELGDAIHTVLRAVGYNIRWLMRAILSVLAKPIITARIWRWLYRELTEMFGGVDGVRSAFGTSNPAFWAFQGRL